MNIVKDHHDIQPEGHGSVYDVEGRVLGALGAALGGPVLELGACMGISSRYILDGLQPLEDLTSLDLRHQWTGPSQPNHFRIECDSGEYEDKETQYRWAFIDGDHTYEGVKRDLGTVLRHGIHVIVFHDTSPSLESHLREGVPENGAHLVAQELAASGEWHVVELGTPCGMVVARKL